MLDEDYAGLAAAGGAVVAQAAGTEGWPALRTALGQWFGRGNARREEATLTRLGATAEKLAAAPRKEQEALREGARQAWATRIRDLLEDLDPEDVADAAEALRELLVTTAEPESEPEPAQEPALVPAPVLPTPTAKTPSGNVHITATDHSLAVQQAGTVNYHQYQHVTPITRLHLPNRIGHVPPPAPHFRPREVPELAATGLGGPPLLLAGTAGTGKTQLAAGFAQQAWDSGDIDLLLWIDASSRTAVLDAYADAARKLHGHPYPDRAEGVDAFLGVWLRPAGGKHEHRWLIVLDGVTDPADLDGLWPPASPAGRVVLTSHRRDLAGPDGTAPTLVPVRGFLREEVRRYLDVGLGPLDRGPVDDAQLVRLLDVIGDAPRFLAVAVERIAADDITLDVYLDRVESAQYEPFTHTSRWQSVLAAQTVSSPGMGISVLQLVAVLGTGAVPEEVLCTKEALSLLVRLAPVNGGTDQAEASRKSVLDAVRDLHGMSLLERERHGTYPTVRIDAAMRRAVLAAVPTALEESLVTGAADALLAAWPEQEPGAVEARLLRSAAYALTTGGSDFALFADGIHPVVFRAGLSAGTWGQPVAAERHLREAVEIASLADPNPDILKARAQAARWRGARGDDFGAAAELTAVLAEQRATLAADHPDILATRLHLAWCELSARGWDVAGPRNQLTAVVREYISKLGPEHPGTIEAVTVAVDALVQRLEDGTTVDGADARTVAGRLRVAETASRTGEFALTDLVSAWHAELARTLGPRHPDTLHFRQMLCAIHLAAGDKAAARELVTGATADALQALGPEHPVTFDGRQLALLLDHYGGAASHDAVAALLADRERTLGPDHPDCLETRELQLTMLTTGESAADLADHRGAYADLLADAERVFGADHRRVRRLLRDIAKAEAAAENHVAAVVTFADLVSRSVRVLGADHPTTLDYRHSLARQRGEAGDLTGALVEFAALRTDDTRVLGPYHPETVVTRHNLAWFRAEAGDIAGALTDLERLVRDLESIPDPPDGSLPAAREALAAWRKKAAN
ncbi:hypothetical protein [Actinacidiphila epipremni]|uniref:Tetratricopeptide repeat protein n=1 Tax=Actinacidiphila epipremni TaxID=2053013 RepID=A0ABX0ZHZ1_9ACTN|nr:hypothetical protein [Actinacidiphila epipremni]NJP43375.1 hypothetical protein [Actinacidiphila epipremni]